MKRFLFAILVMGYVLSMENGYAEPQKRKPYLHMSIPRDAEHQDGYDKCIKKIDPIHELMEFEKMKPEQQADLCVDILKKHHPEIIKEIDILTFKGNIIKGMYKNSTTKTD